MVILPIPTTGAIPVGKVWATMGKIYGDDFPDDIKKDATALGQRLVEAFEKKETSHKFEKQAADFRERMRQLMLWRKEDWPYEYEYWKKHYGLE